MGHRLQFAADRLSGGRNADLSIDRCLSLRMSPLSLCLPRQLLISLEFCRRSERANPRSIVDAWGCRNLFPKSWMLLLGSKASFCRRKCRFTPAFWGHAHEVDVIAPPLSGQDDEMPPPTAAPVREAGRKGCLNFHGCGNPTRMRCLAEGAGEVL